MYVFIYFLVGVMCDVAVDKIDDLFCFAFTECASFPRGLCWVFCALFVPFQLCCSVAVVGVVFMCCSLQ